MLTADLRATTGVVTVANLESHSWSSFPKFLRKKTRPPFLQCGDWLPGITGQADTPADWRRYRELLDELNGLSSAEKEKAFDGLSQGTVLGTNSFRRAVWDDFKKMDLAKDWGQSMGSAGRQPGTGASGNSDGPEVSATAEFAFSGENLIAAVAYEARGPA